jgi:ribose-phosphate pyrophosphokinase
MRNTQVFAGSSHPELTAHVCKRLGIPVADATLKKFSNRETSVEICKFFIFILKVANIGLSILLNLGLIMIDLMRIGSSVRNQDIFIIQSGSTSINDNLIELSIMIQACRMGSAKRITAVLPYFPYCKQSKRKGRTCITAKCKRNALVQAF